MDKFLFGKILGEIYRIQNRDGYCPVSEGKLYGLLNGVEDAIDEEISSLSPISNEKLKKVSNILNPYWKDPAKLADLDGYYDLENEFEAAGLDRGDLITILTYYKASRRYTDIIEKIEKGTSPVEFKSLDLNDWDR